MDLSHARRPSALSASAASRSAHPAVLSDHRRDELPVAETSLSAGLRFRLSLLGIGLGLAALAVCTGLGLLIVAGPFHTSLGSLA